MKSYRALPPDLDARVILCVPPGEEADASMLGCTWDRARNSWWIDRDSIADTPYVYRWMDGHDPMKAAAHCEYLRLERHNRKTMKSRTRRAKQRRYH